MANKVILWDEVESKVPDTHQFPSVFSINEPEESVREQWLKAHSLKKACNLSPMSHSSFRTFLQCLMIQKFNRRLKSQVIEAYRGH